MTRNFPLSGRKTSHEYSFRPTGDAATDTAQWAGLVAAINAQTNGGNIVIRDNGQQAVIKAGIGYSTSSNFVKPARVRGESVGSRIRFEDGFQIKYYGDENIFDSGATMPAWVTRGTMSAVQARKSLLTGVSIPLTRGDWVVVYADNALTNVEPHVSGGQQRPAELHRVEFSPATDQYNLDGEIYDPLTTSPKIAKISMLKNCSFENLTVGSNRLTAGTATLTAFLDVFGCHGFRMENVQVDETGAGWTAFECCADTIISNYSGLYQPNNALDYGLVINLCRGLIYQDSVWHNSRHIVTTGGQLTSTNIRWGTPRGIQINNIIGYMSGDSYSNDYAMFDTHAEGEGIQFNGCEAHCGLIYTPAGAEENFIGFSGRARNTFYNNCKVFVGRSNDETTTEADYKNVHRGFQLIGANNTLTDCYVRGAYIGYEARVGFFGSNLPGMRFINCEADECAGASIWWDTARDNAEVIGFRARNSSGYYATGTPYLPGAIIVMRGGTGHKIRDSYLDRGPNHYSLSAGSLATTDIEFVSNYTRGYSAHFSGSNKIGVRGDTGDPKSPVSDSPTGASFQSTYSAVNYTS